MASTVQLFTIGRDRPGTLSTLAAPREPLEAAMADLAAAGVTVLVSALSTPEVDGLALGSEGELAARHRDPGETDPVGRSSSRAHVAQRDWVDELARTR